MNFRKAFIPLLPLVCLCLPAIAQEVPPPATLRYHAALLKSPHNEALFSKFYETWIDEQPIESLETFLIERAEARGGNHFAILANYQIRRGQDDNALATLSKASEALPDDHTLRMERAKILFRRLELEAARESMKPVLAGNDESLSIEAAKLIGKSYLRESDPQAAHQTWETLLKKYPGNEDILEDLVELTASARQFETALEYSERLIAVSTDPFKKALRQIRKGELLAQSAENDKAVALWSETLAKTGEGSWLEREIIAHIEKSYRRQDRVDQLTEKLAELAEANPRRFAIHRELAKLEAAAGNMDSAIGRFRVLLKRSPGDHALREEFIRMLMDGERFDDAAEVLEKMISLDPKNPELHLRMAAIRFSQDDSAATLTALEKALGLSPDDESFAIRVASLCSNTGSGNPARNSSGSWLILPLRPRHRRKLLPKNTHEQIAKSSPLSFWLKSRKRPNWKPCYGSPPLSQRLENTKRPSKSFRHARPISPKSRDFSPHSYNPQSLLKSLLKRLPKPSLWFVIPKGSAPSPIIYASP
jgi:tetratricopeptide (TPR) repeat protein